MRLSPGELPSTGDRADIAPPRVINAQNIAPTIFNTFILNHSILSLDIANKTDFSQRIPKIYAPNKIFSHSLVNIPH